MNMSNKISNVLPLLLNAISAIGLLDAQKHYGGMYTGQRFDAVLDEIIDGAVDYTVSDDVVRQRSMTDRERRAPRIQANRPDPAKIRNFSAC